MKLYLDLIFIINFSFDLILLITVNILLKRKINIYNLILGALIGSLSIFLLFNTLTSFQLFLYKVIISIFMCISTFKFKNLKYTLKNLGYLYMVSTILGGFLYMLNVNFSYKQIGIFFINKGLSINYIILIIISPVIIFFYIKQNKELKNNYSNYNDVKIILKDNKVLNLVGYIDSGNNLLYNKKQVIIVNNKLLNKISEYFLIPYTTLNNKGMLKCIIPKEVYINNILIKKKIIVGIQNNEVSMDGVNCILHKNMIGESYVK